MQQTKAIASRFTEVILNGTWIANTNYRVQLHNLDWNIANQKYQSFNTISNLTQHIHYYISGVNNVFKGGTLDIKDKFSFRFPELKSQMEWERILSVFWMDAEKFASFVEQMPEEKLNKIFVEEKYGTYLRNIDGVIEHSYYHLGQIVLIKKALLNE